MNSRDRLRSVRRRMTDPAEALAQEVTERVIDLLVSAVDINAVLKKVDPNVLLDQVDVNALLARVDMDALVQRTDLGAVLARSSGGMGVEALDAVRRQAVGLDQLIDRWVRRLLRRAQATPSAPAALLPARSQP